MSFVDFVVLSPGHGRSVTDFWSWDAHEAQSRCPDGAWVVIEEDVVPGGALNLNVYCIKTLKLLSITSGVNGKFSIDKPRGMQYIFLYFYFQLPGDSFPESRNQAIKLIKTNLNFDWRSVLPFCWTQKYKTTPPPHPQVKYDYEISIHPHTHSHTCTHITTPFPRTHTRAHTINTGWR
jgi:hypothetical protein